MRTDELWDSETAKAYDTPGTGMFSPKLLKPTVERLAELAGEGRALEFAIGTGRIAIPLSERGISVTGIEMSTAMIDQLRTKADESDIPVVVGDMLSYPPTDYVIRGKDGPIAFSTEMDLWPFVATLFGLGFFMGWLPSAPQLKTNPLEIGRAAKAAGIDAKDYVAERLKSGALQMSCEDPDAPENWPRNLFVWRSNLLGSSGKGHGNPSRASFYARSSLSPGRFSSTWAC